MRLGQVERDAPRSVMMPTTASWAADLISLDGSRLSLDGSNTSSDPTLPLVICGGGRAGTAVGECLASPYTHSTDVVKARLC